MPKYIKLIWDMNGPESKTMAEHYTKHLGEFMERENLELFQIGVEQTGDLHSFAYMVVDEKDMIKVRDALKPHRGQEAEL